MEPAKILYLVSKTMNLGFPIIDLHAHLRNNISEHTKIAREAGIDLVVYMANCQPPLDNLDRIKQSLKQKRYCRAIPVSAITKNLDGKKLVDVAKIKSYVDGFSDDGKYLKDLGLLKKILTKGVLVLAHCSPSYEKSFINPIIETKFIERYLPALQATKGKLHIQHISKKESVKLIRDAKTDGLHLTCETCPHYFTYTKDDLTVKVNPPLATKKDIMAIKEGLADGTIDVISSDYAPLPRKTGLAGFRSLVPLSYGLVLEGVLSIEQLKEKLFVNPKKIIESGEIRLNLNETISI